MRRTGTILAGLLCLVVFTAHAAHTQAQLILSADIARPGDTIWAGVDLKMEPGWHTYWKNPGAAGMATKIEWQLPPGITAGEIQWPLPEKFPPAEVTTYGYENEVVLLMTSTRAITKLDTKATIRLFLFTSTIYFAMSFLYISLIVSNTDRYSSVL